MSDEDPQRAGTPEARPAGRRLPVLPVEPALDPGQAPEVGFVGLDTLWLQLTGTLCNIACRHCFITCGPDEDRVPMMSRPRIEALLTEARELGVKEFYLTGGEPMLHPEFFPLLERLLTEGPVHVLTNGLLIDAAAAARLRALADGTRYSLELRVSLDGMSAAENDPVRGRGTFERAVVALGHLAAVGLSPVLTVVEHAQGMAAAEARQRFLEFARGLGLVRPRVKFLPLLRLGREARRTRGYHDDELVPELVAGAADALQCTSSRLCTEHHVLTCPILLDAPEARLGTTLHEAARAIRLRWSACHTCVVEGLSCRT